MSTPDFRKLARECGEMNDGNDVLEAFFRDVWNDAIDHASAKAMVRAASDEVVEAIRSLKVTPGYGIR